MVIVPKGSVSSLRQVVPAALQSVFATQAEPTAPVLAPPPSAVGVTRVPASGADTCARTSKDSSSLGSCSPQATALEKTAKKNSHFFMLSRFHD
jgi:hypothetical protein